MKPLVQSVGQSLCTLPPAEPSECGVLLHRQTEGSVTNMQGVNASMSAYTFVYQDSYFIYHSPKSNSHCTGMEMGIQTLHIHVLSIQLPLSESQHRSSSRVKCSCTVHMSNMLLHKAKCERKVLICVADTRNYFSNVHYFALW